MKCLKKVIFIQKMCKKIMIFKAKFPKNGKFQGIFFFVFLPSFSLQRIFFAKIFCDCKESLLAIQYNININYSKKYRGKIVLDATYYNWVWVEKKYTRVIEHQHCANHLIYYITKSSLVLLTSALDDCENENNENVFWHFWQCLKFFSIHV